MFCFTAMIARWLSRTRFGVYLAISCGKRHLQGKIIRSWIWWIKCVFWCFSKVTKLSIYLVDIICFDSSQKIIWSIFLKNVSGMRTRYGSIRVQRHIVCVFFFISDQWPVWKLKPKYLLFYFTFFYQWSTTCMGEKCEL